MLSRSFRTWNEVIYHEGVDRAARRWANFGHHGGSLPLCLYSSLSKGNAGHAIWGPSSLRSEVSSQEKTSIWERFNPRLVYSRITNFLRSSGPSADTRDEAARNSIVVFMKGEDSQKMGAEELGMLLRSMGQNVTKEELEEIMKVANSSESGSGTLLDFPTFMKNMVGKIEGSELERELVTVFEGIDKDKDGFISAHELRQGISDLGVKLSDSNFEEIVRDSGAGVDGCLNFEDFVKVMMAQSEFWE